MKMGLREYARYKGVSPAAVVRAVEAGRIKKDPDGKIDSDKADKMWAENTNPALQREKKQTPQAPPTVPAPVVSAPSQQRGLPTLPESVQAHAYYRAQTARQNYEREKGTLVVKKDVEDAMFAENRRVRDRLMAVSSRISPIVASMTNMQEVEQVVYKAIYDALLELS